MKNITDTTNSSEQRILAKGLTADTDGYKTRLNSNIAVIGSAGSGKTTGIVEPNLATCTNSSFIVTDTKGLLARKWRKSLEARGYDVKILDFVNFDKSSYDPLGYVRRTTDKITGKIRYNDLDIAGIANFLTQSSTSRDPYWENAAANELMCLISFCLENMPKEEQNLATCVDLLRLAKVTENKCIPFLEEYAYKNPESLCARTYANMAKTFLSEKTWSSVESVAATSVSKFDGFEIRSMMKKAPDFRFRDLGKKKTAVFFNVSDLDHTFDGFVNLAYTQAILDLAAYADSMPDGRLPVETTLWFDDFGASCVIPDFPRWISVLRSRRISSVICLQSYTQLTTNYTKEEASTVISNCDRLLYLGSNDYSTQTLISNLGNLRPEKVMTLSNDQAIYIERGMKHARFVEKNMPGDYSHDTVCESNNETSGTYIEPGDLDI